MVIILPRMVEIRRRLEDGAGSKEVCGEYRHGLVSRFSSPGY